FTKLYLLLFCLLTSSTTSLTTITLSITYLPFINGNQFWSTVLYSTVFSLLVGFSMILYILPSIGIGLYFSKP
ncbi:hypothetical protein VIGAN_11123000, partial [Vigna angularis var. angularis]